MVSPPPGLAVSALLCAFVVSQPALAERLTVGTVVSRLADAGQPVVYSSDYLNADALLELPEVSIDTFRAALEPMGLTLQRVGDNWVVTPARVAAESQLRIRSADDVPLRNLEVQWRGQRFPLTDVGGGTHEIPVQPGSLVSVHASAHRQQLVRLGREPSDVVLASLERVENVIVTGTRHRLAGRDVTGSVTSLTADDLATVPALGGDNMRTVAQLPGMSSVGVSAKPRIRGGLQDELLVRLDGVELLDPFHLADFQSMFSAIDDRSVETVDVYTGAFPARYGNRMSGVMDISTEREPPEARTELGLSLFSLLANTQGVTDDGDTDFLASVRRGNLHELLRQVDPDHGRPRYHDFLARVGHRFSPSGRATVGLLITRDDIVLEEDETSARSDIDDRYLWGRLDHDHGNGITSSSSLTYTWSRRSRQLGDLDDDSGTGGFIDHQMDLWKLGVRTDWSVSREDRVLELGAQAEYGSSRYRSVALVDRGLTGTVLAGNASSGHDIRIAPDGWSGGVYLAAGLPLTESLTLQPGLRWDVQAIDSQDVNHHLSPRLGLRYQRNGQLTMHVDVGRYHQPEALHELQAADGVQTYSRPQSADHLIAGASWLPAARWELRADVYLKHYRHTKRRFENLFNPFVLVPELEPDRIAVDPRRARARGGDLALRHYFSEHAYASLRYGFLDAEDRLDADWVPRRWSQRHTVNALVSWQGPRLAASASLTWHSGWRGARLPDSVPAGTVLDPTDVMNRRELDDYVSLDVSVRRIWHLGRTRITAFAGVTNLTNRDNVAGIDYDAELDGGTVVFERERETLLPLVPSAGLLISF